MSNLSFNFSNLLLVVFCAFSIFVATIQAQWIEEIEPELQARLAKIVDFRHKKPVRAVLLDQLPDTTDIYCEPSHGRSGAKNTRCFTYGLCFNLKKRRFEAAERGERAGFDLKTLQTDAYFSSNQEFAGWSFKFSNFSGLEEAQSASKRVILFDNPALIISRFVPGNLMHTLHDDFMPTLMTIAGSEELRDVSPKEARLIVSIDPHARALGSVLDWLGEHFNINGLERFFNRPELKDLTHACFSEAVIGQSTSTTWYEYGKFKPQGPISGMNRLFTGSNLRFSIDWLKERLDVERGLTTSSQEVFKAWLKGAAQVPNDSRAVISLLSRGQNRKMTNEAELRERLQAEFPGSQVMVLREEEMKPEELIEWASRSVVMIGMHGASMILSAFMPPKSVVVEMFPFGVPVENYTPYRTMASLPGIDLIYRVWVNPREEEPFNRGFPERHYIQGGISNLPASYQYAVKALKTVPRHVCCYSPFWMYRIYQDTFVEVNDILKLVRGAMLEATK